MYVCVFGYIYTCMYTVREMFPDCDCVHVGMCSLIQNKKIQPEKSVLISQCQILYSGHLITQTSYEKQLHSHTALD